MSLINTEEDNRFGINNIYLTLAEQWDEPNAFITLRCEYSVTGSNGGFSTGNARLAYVRFPMGASLVRSIDKIVWKFRRAYNAFKED